ncbi:MAG: DNA-directed RNA polymerase subunit beta' [Eubacteriales bacterium]|nr:DNA-directed RNA polymerase subunit beta' [Eubacteriales bacterium]
MFELNNLASMRIGIASPEKILEWSYGEVTKSETINYRTHKPEMGGLLCERIFGPKKNWECHCGKYKRIRHKGVICDKCGVEVTKSSVRRERMGHIQLATPVAHIWYMRSIPSRIGTLLNLNTKQLEKVIYYVSYIVIDPGKTNFVKYQLINDIEYRDAIEQYGNGCCKVGMGGEAIRELLSEIDLEKEHAELSKASLTAKGQNKLKINKRLEIIDSLIKSGNRPEWLILTVLPVIPPDVRPMIQLDGGRFATSDINDLYRRIINRNNRLKKFMSIGAPEVIIRNEKRMLQEAVDALIENGKSGKAVAGPKQRELKSLTQNLKGKQGRFRQNLLGKRVDYSGRSVIVVGPELKMYQCGLPKEMALELFKPFIMHKLVERNLSLNFKSAKRLIDSQKPCVWDILEEVIKDHPVMLNRAPSLHRLSIQAFEPVLVEGRAIKLHPLVCGGFNADFDGDQMSVHVPLSPEAVAEARILMLSSNNVLKPATGDPICTPTQDMVLGSYYLTIEKEGAKGEGKCFISEEEAIMAYQTKNVDIQAPIYVRRTNEFEGQPYTSRVKTTVGKIIFNRGIPQNLGFVDRSKKENVNNYEIDFEVGKKGLDKIIKQCFDTLGTTETVKMLDNIKSIGYKYSTIGAITINVFDMEIPKEKDELVTSVEQQVAENNKFFRRGFITEDEKLEKNIKLWKDATKQLEGIVLNKMDKLNPVRMMANSGARGNAGQILQLCGMRGIMANTSGRKVDIPVKSNFRMGLTPIEYFLSSRGGRKGLADKVLKTADSGYLTRRLVDVAQDVVVVEDDCFANNGGKIRGLTVSAISKDGTPVCSLKQRIVGRFAVDNVVNPKTKKIIIPANTMITPEQADEVEACGITSVAIRTVLTCSSKHGVCAKCYGKNMSNNNIIPIGEAVGIIAAQSIGEPGTQLTMRTFHTGGVANAADITQGLPRVAELFEARRPKGVATVAEVAGKVVVKEVQSAGKDGGKYYEVFVKNPEGDGHYIIPFGVVLKVKNGDTVEAGTVLTEGAIYPKDFLRTRGVRDVEEYILSEILATYSSQGVKLNTKHVEIIIRQMLRNVKIEEVGDTNLLAGDIVDIFKYEEENDRVLSEGGVPATAKRLVQGITKAALSCESFLSAASFQETSRVLTDASMKGKVDHLRGLKENLMIGKAIPAGTGFKTFKNVEPVDPNEVEEKSTEVDESVAKFFDENEAM